MSATRRIRRIVDAKCKKADINKVMAKQHQHLNIKETEILLSLLKKYEERFGGTLGMWNIALVYLELRDDAKPVCLRPYPFSRVHKDMFRKEV